MLLCCIGWLNIFEHIRQPLLTHRCCLRNPLTMKTATNLFLLPDYTLANFFLLSALETFKIYSPFIKKIKADGVIQQAALARYNLL